MRTICLLVVSIMLAACSPDYNWRAATLGAGEVVAFFPQKPLTQQRNLDYQGQQIAFSLTTASVGRAVFAVGYAPLPESIRNDASLREGLFASTLGSLYGNLGAKPPTVLPAQGEHFEVRGKAANGEARLRATVWLTPDALVEGLVSADAADFPDAQADQFFQSLSLPD